MIFWGGGEERCQPIRRWTLYVCPEGLSLGTNDWRSLCSSLRSFLCWQAHMSQSCLSLHLITAADTYNALCSTCKGVALSLSGTKEDCILFEPLRDAKLLTSPYGTKNEVLTYGTLMITELWTLSQRNAKGSTSSVGSIDDRFLDVPRLSPKPLNSAWKVASSSLSLMTE